jgi:flagellar motor switch protein FliN/FliY
MNDNVDLQDFDEENNEQQNEGVSTENSGDTIDALLNVPLNVQIVLGDTKLPVSQVLKLSRGSVLELDKKIGESVDIMINERLVARGDLVKVEGDRVGVTLTEIVKEYFSES